MTDVLTELTERFQQEEFGYKTYIAAVYLLGRLSDKPQRFDYEYVYLKFGKLVSISTIEKTIGLLMNLGMVDGVKISGKYRYKLSEKFRNYSVIAPHLVRNCSTIAPQLTRNCSVIDKNRNVISSIKVLPCDTLVSVISPSYVRKYSIAKLQVTSKQVKKTSKEKKSLPEERVKSIQEVFDYLNKLSGASYQAFRKDKITQDGKFLNSYLTKLVKGKIPVRNWRLTEQDAVSLVKKTIEIRSEKIDMIYLRPSTLWKWQKSEGFVQDSLKFGWKPASAVEDKPKKDLFAK